MYGQASQLRVSMAMTSCQHHRIDQNVSSGCKPIASYSYPSHSLDPNSRSLDPNHVSLSFHSGSNRVFLLSVFLLSEVASLAIDATESMS
jgi:hypothetical protein